MMIADAIQVLAGDALTSLRRIPDKTVQACMTSPPFYLLRRYGSSSQWPDGWEGELGHESHPNDFVRHLLYVFDEVWRTMRDDGCLWVNLADTYNNKQGKKGTTNAPDGSNGRYAAGGKGYATALRQQPEFFKHFVPGIPHKSEMGVPFRFHLAMTDLDFRRFVGAPEGPQWICRRTIIWAKSLVRLETQTAEGNAMPEPTRDRPSRNYEYLFLFTKQPDYYFDRTKIDVQARTSNHNGAQANAGSVWATNSSILSDSDPDTDGVWRINSEASPYRHVAMWPRALVQQMIAPCTRENDIILDPFAGSGTTGEMAYRMGRRAILVEPSETGKNALADRIFQLNDRLL
jgi:site-specific DNA-methyltransferase (cytosine-N4-specific)